MGFNADVFGFDGVLLGLDGHWLGVNGDWLGFNGDLLGFTQLKIGMLVDIPSCKQPHRQGTPPFLMGKSTN